jgi:DNA-binding NtrC family response regulator
MAVSANRVVELTLKGSFAPGHSPMIQTLNMRAGEIARTNILVLLEGESGTGKEVCLA